MAQPYVGELRLFAGNFAPSGWLVCWGQLVPISEYETLFNLIGTTYGGDGQETFALPDLRGRVPVHQGNGYVLGETGGVEEVTLTVLQIPGHSHALVADPQPGTRNQGAGRVLAATEADSYVTPGNPPVALAATSVGSSGGSQPHTNMMPFLGLNYIISLYGIFPTT
jgi:microcystin-dependent protein